MPYDVYCTQNNSTVTIQFVFTLRLLNISYDNIIVGLTSLKCELYSGHVSFLLGYYVIHILNMSRLSGSEHLSATSLDILYEMVLVSQILIWGVGTCGSHIKASLPIHIHIPNPDHIPIYKSTPMVIIMCIMTSIFITITIHIQTPLCPILIPNPKKVTF